MRAASSPLFLIAGVFVSLAISFVDAQGGLPAETAGYLEKEAAKKKEREDAEVQKDAEDAEDAKHLLKKMTIAMASDVIDERTVVIRNTGSGKDGNRNLYIRLGNVAAVPEDAPDRVEKVNVAKEALKKLVDKQMIWYKAAPESVQAGQEGTLVGDVWTIDGKHIGGSLRDDGLLNAVKEYTNEIGEDILTVKSEKEKKESYAKLEIALKESEEAKKKAAAEKAAKDAEEEERREWEANTEPLGLLGWSCIAGVVALFGVGVATNFGRKSNKKVNLNRKKGFIEKTINSVTKTLSGSKD